MEEIESLCQNNEVLRRRGEASIEDNTPSQNAHTEAESHVVVIDHQEDEDKRKI